MFTLEQAATQTGVSIATIKQRIKEGKITTIKEGGQQLLDGQAVKWIQDNVTPRPRKTHDDYNSSEPVKVPANLFERNETLENTVKEQNVTITILKSHLENEQRLKEALQDKIADKQADIARLQSQVDRKDAFFEQLMQQMTTDVLSRVPNFN